MRGFVWKRPGQVGVAPDIDLRCAENCLRRQIKCHVQKHCVQSLTRHTPQKPAKKNQKKCKLGKEGDSEPGNRSSSLWQFKKNCGRDCMGSARAWRAAVDVPVSRAGARHRATTRGGARRPTAKARSDAREARALPIASPILRPQFLLNRSNTETTGDSGFSFSLKRFSNNARCGFRARG